VTLALDPDNAVIEPTEARAQMLAAAFAEVDAANPKKLESIIGRAAVSIRIARLRGDELLEQDARAILERARTRLRR
jgi:hypothetical protein